MGIPLGDDRPPQRSIHLNALSDCTLTALPRFGTQVIVSRSTVQVVFFFGASREWSTSDIE
jgi:hypothetical protein